MTKHQHYFKHYPLSKEVFETSDGQLFHKEHDAKAHAAELSNGSVKKITKEEAAKGDEQPEAPEAPETGKGKKGKGSKGADADDAKPEGEGKPEGK